MKGEAANTAIKKMARTTYHHDDESREELEALKDQEAFDASSEHDIDARDKGRKRYENMKERDKRRHDWRENGY